MSQIPRKLIARLLAAISGALVVSVVSAEAAPAHISVDSAQPNPDGKTTLTLAFNHGCGTSPTTAISVDFPKDSEVTPTTAPTGWESSLSTTEETTKVSWTGPAIPSEKKAEFVVTARLSGTPGQTAWFPAVQNCENNQHYDWVETTANAKEPAPSVVLTAAMVPASNTTTGEASDGDNSSLWIALGAVLVGTVGAATFTYLRERRS